MAHARHEMAGGTEGRGTSNEEPQQLVEEAEGVRLYLSARSMTGYRGVDKDGGKYRARTNRSGQRVLLGYFGTAIEAALACARYEMAGGTEGCGTTDEVEVEVESEPSVSEGALSAGEELGYDELGRMSDADDEGDEVEVEVDEDDSDDDEANAMDAGHKATREASEAKYSYGTVLWAKMKCDAA